MNTVTESGREGRPIPAFGPNATNSPSPGGAAGTARPEPALRPPVDVIEDSTGITLYADLPGVPRDQLHIQVDGDQLRIEGAVAITLPEGLQPQHTELGLPRWRRSFTLSKELDAAQVSAELSHGVLRLRIPKAAHAQPQRVRVVVG